MDETHAYEGARGLGNRTTFCPSHLFLRVWCICKLTTVWLAPDSTRILNMQYIASCNPTHSMPLAGTLIDCIGGGVGILPPWSLASMSPHTKDKKVTDTAHLIPRLYLPYQEL